MIDSIEEYLRQLKKELAGSDRAVIQDALADAGEYLRDALENTRKNDPAVSQPEALLPIIEEYGTPTEIAAAYKRVEMRLSRAQNSGARVENRPPAARFFVRFFGVMSDPRAWGALFYLLLSLATGIIYFTWAVTGISVSAGLLILIIGLPLAWVFLLSVKGLALLEGRLIEALLGIRMPRRPFFSSQNPGFWNKFKSVFADRHTWFGLGYMILMLPLGIFYFSLSISLISVSLWLITRPILELGFGAPIFTAGVPYYTPLWVMPFAVIGGALLLVITMHVVRCLGIAHGRLAKAMLVRE
jgi:hypothetical protein